MVYNAIREGIPLYDSGFFTPWKRLLKMGKIQGTREAIESYMEDAPRRIARAKGVKLLILAEDCYYAIVNSAQAVLMFMDVEPPVPSKLYDTFVEYLVKPGIVEEEYADWVKEIVKIRKDIEHRRMLEADGFLVDLWIERAEKFVDKMFSILNALEIIKKKKVLEKTYEVLVEAIATALKYIHGLPENLKASEVEEALGLNLKDAFKRDFIESKKIEPYYLEVLNRIENLKKQVLEENRVEALKGSEIEQLRRYVARLIYDLSKLTRENS